MGVPPPGIGCKIPLFWSISTHPNQIFAENDCGSVIRIRTPKHHVFLTFTRGGQDMKLSWSDAWYSVNIQRPDPYRVSKRINTNWSPACVHTPTRKINFHSCPSNKFLFWYYDFRGTFSRQHKSASPANTAYKQFPVHWHTTRIKILHPSFHDTSITINFHSTLQKW